MNKTWRPILAGGIMTLLCLGPSACADKTADGPPETVTIAAVATELNALAFIAEEKGYFTGNGLEIVYKAYDSGASAAAGMLNGEADIAFAAEFPVVRQVFNGKDIVNFGTICRYENTYIIWRAGAGIETIGDLKGKKIGVTLGTISEFCLGRTPELNGLNIAAGFNLVNVTAPESENALLSGAVDAVVIWEPWVDQIRKRLGAEAHAQVIQSAQFAYWNLVSTGSWVSGHTGAINKLLAGLAQAEEFIVSHQGEAKAIVSERMNFSPEYTDAIWPRYRFSLSLEQSLIVAMEDEARWLIKNKLTAATSVPDFVGFINEGALKKLKPDAVRIIR